MNRSPLTDTEQCHQNLELRPIPQAPDVSPYEFSPLGFLAAFADNIAKQQTCY